VGLCPHVVHMTQCFTVFSPYPTDLGYVNRLIGEHAVAQWLRHCATNHKVAGAIPDGVF
jgi:hypothetical protein